MLWLFIGYQSKKECSEYFRDVLNRLQVSFFHISFYFNAFYKNCDYAFH